MALHLIKLAVGVNDLAHMKTVQAARRKQRRQTPRSPHWVYTRNTPRRADELLAGGSLYWVVRGVIRCRQELVGFEMTPRWTDADGNLVPLERFIAIAEETGLIHTFAENVLRKACGAARLFPATAVSFESPSAHKPQKTI